MLWEFWIIFHYWWLPDEPLLNFGHDRAAKSSHCQKKRCESQEHALAICCNEWNLSDMDWLGCLAFSKQVAEKEPLDAWRGVSYLKPTHCHSLTLQRVWDIAWCTSSENLEWTSEKNCSLERTSDKHARHTQEVQSRDGLRSPARSLDPECFHRAKCSLWITSASPLERGRLPHSGRHRASTSLNETQPTHEHYTHEHFNRQNKRGMNISAHPGKHERLTACSWKFITRNNFQSFIGLLTMGQAQLTQSQSLAHWSNVHRA